MIPEWLLQGILPPYIGGDPTASANMSPYRTTMKAFVQRFGTSPERLEIIEGLLKYRAALVAEGFTGYQWLSGSFVEKVEAIRNRSPKDVDVVSIVNRPPAYALPDDWRGFLASEKGDLFDPDVMKDAYFCDTYLIDMNDPPYALVSASRFWYGLFAHQRLTTAWKGMIVIPLSPEQDAEARTILAPIVNVVNE